MKSVSKRFSGSRQTFLRFFSASAHNVFRFCTTVFHCSLYSSGIGGKGICFLSRLRSADFPVRSNVRIPVGRASQFPQTISARELLRTGKSALRIRQIDPPPQHVSFLPNLNFSDPRRIRER